MFCQLPFRETSVTHCLTTTCKKLKGIFGRLSKPRLRAQQSGFLWQVSFGLFQTPPKMGGLSRNGCGSPPFALTLSSVLPSAREHMRDMQAGCTSAMSTPLRNRTMDSFGSQLQQQQAVVLLFHV